MAQAISKVLKALANWEMDHSNGAAEFKAKYGYNRSEAATHGTWNGQTRKEAN